MIDLDNVHGKCNGLVEDSVRSVDEIGSDKVIFDGADIIISKLEPYLAKCIVRPDPEAIGTTEWVGFKCKDVDPIVIGYLLSRPEMREAMRMLQSGKRHARLNPKELLELRFNKSIGDISVDQILIAEKRIHDAKKPWKDIGKKLIAYLIDDSVCILCSKQLIYGMISFSLYIKNCRPGTSLRAGCSI